MTVNVILERSNDNWGEYTQVRGEYTQVRGEYTQVRGEYTQVRGESARPERLGGVN